MTIKFVDTSLLRVGYEEWNGDAPRAVMLLHGWPDSPRLWRRVASKLAAAGYRVIAPALRGFAPGTLATYSGSSSVRMLKRHLQHTLPGSTRGGIARISTFMFGS